MLIFVEMKRLALIIFLLIPLLSWAQEESEDAYSIAEKQFFEADYPECPYPTDNGFLTLSTIHSAKGLEWDNVFIMGLAEGTFPNPYFCKGKTPAEVEEFFNAEWKKMYVASTRARESLVLSYATMITRKGFSFKKCPSRFISSQPMASITLTQ